MNTLNIEMNPFWEKETINKIKIEIMIDKKLTHLIYPSSGFSNRIPFPNYENLMIQDDEGEIFYQISESIYEGPLEYKRIEFLREQKGNLRYSYIIYPRILPKDYRSCPYYDFRNEEAGATGSGLFSLILPEENEFYYVNVHWNLSHLPKNAKGLFNFEKNSVMDLLYVKFSFFIVGITNQISSEGTNFYWLSQPTFDLESIAKKVVNIFNYMKVYSNDKDSKFTIFIRRDPFEKSGGGTACPYAFISGYSTLETTDIRYWQNVLIHEMTHTWPRMEESVSGYPLTWFNEGMVEYYCTFIPYEGGFCDKEYVLDLINNKANERYYCNQYRSFSENEIEKVQWEDMAAQMVPYGRGFMYISLVNNQ